MSHDRREKADISRKGFARRCHQRGERAPFVFIFHALEIEFFLGSGEYFGGGKGATSEVFGEHLPKAIGRSWGIVVGCAEDVRRADFMGALADPGHEARFSNAFLAAHKCEVSALGLVNLYEHIPEQVALGFAAYKRHRAHFIESDSGSKELSREGFSVSSAPIYRNGGRRGEQGRFVTGGRVRGVGLRKFQERNGEFILGNIGRKMMVEHVPGRNISRGGLGGWRLGGRKWNPRGRSVGRVG